MLFAHQHISVQRLFVTVSLKLGQNEAPCVLQFILKISEIFEFDVEALDDIFGFAFRFAVILWSADSHCVLNNVKRLINSFPDKLNALKGKQGSDLKSLIFEPVVLLPFS